MNNMNNDVKVGCFGCSYAKNKGWGFVCSLTDTIRSDPNMECEYRMETTEVSNMNNDVDVRKRLDDVVKNLMKSIIPKQINGHDLYGGYAVDMYNDSYVNVQFGIGFTPIREDSEITCYFGFAQGMPLCGASIDDSCYDFEKSIREEIVKRLALLCESVNKDTQ